MVIIKKKSRSEKSHVLHCWQLFDDNHLISRTLCNLSDGLRVYSYHVPITIEVPGSASKEAEKKLEKEFKEKVSASFSQLVHNNSLNQHRIEKNNFRELASEYKDFDDNDEKIMLKKDMEESDKILPTLKSNLNFD